jgi:iron complex transport system ATP-binding protein
LIEVVSLRCGYGKREVLKGIDLHLHAGEMTGILGPNGSGKSTLLLAIAGVMPIWSGSVRLLGQDVQDKGSRWRARRMASVPQRTTVTFPFRCLSLVLMGRYPYLTGWGGYSQQDMDVALRVMERTDTLHLAQRRINEVSGGESQLVIISRALAQETDILLLDEAASSLDAARKIQVFDLLREKNRQGTTLLCVMHDLNLAALYCRRLVFLKDGKVALDGPTTEIFNDENLSQIYETDIRVSRHPIDGIPQAHFVPGGRDPSPG